jgi:hypothetical protein
VTGIITFFTSRARIAAAVVALLLLALASVVVPAFNGDGGSLMAQTSEALSRFVGRSPGERGETDLLKTKVKGAKKKFSDKLLASAPRAKDSEPEQRALGKIFDTPPEDAVRALGDPTVGPLALGDPDPGQMIPLGDIGTAGGNPIPGGFPGGISTVVPPGTSAVPGDPTDPTTPPGTDPGIPPVAAVPEPGTWALMLIGFGLCGAAMRRRNTKGSGKPGIA